MCNVKEKFEPRGRELCALCDREYHCVNVQDGEYGKYDRQCTGNAGAGAGICSVF